MSVEVETIRTVEVPTRMVHGLGAIARLGELVKELGVKRPFLVTDRGVVSAGLADEALKHLEDALVFDEVQPNPDIELVGHASTVYREAGCDGLVALGGGSSSIQNAITRPRCDTACKYQSPRYRYAPSECL